MAGAAKQFPHPPRLVGNPGPDIALLGEYVWSLYRSLILENGGVVQVGDLGAVASLNQVGTSQLQNHAVTLVKLLEVPTNVLLGRATAGTGDVELITLTAAGRALIDDANAAAQRSTLGLGALATKTSIDTADINDAAVTLVKIQDIATNSILGRFSGGTGDVEVITASAGARTFITDEIPLLKSYTVAGVPSAATYAQGLIYVSNEVGGAVPAFSDGANWRRVTDRAVIS